MSTTSRFLLLPIVIALAACEAEPTQSKADAQLGWRNTQMALSSAGVTTAWSATGMVGPDGVSGAVMGDVECPGGGSLHVSAEGEVDAAQVHGQLRIDFHACTVDDVTIDGYLDYEAIVEEHRVAAEYHGDLEWSGALSGSCAVDASAEVTTQGTNAGVHVSGGVCGHDWADIGV
jgi:hypothetical protein